MIAISYEYLASAIRIASVVVPVALYFLLLGLLNSRRKPQLLTGQQDFGLLMAALCPLFVLPILTTIGITLWTVLIALGASVGGVMVLMPRGRAWVVYNLPSNQIRKVIAQAAASMGEAVEQVGGGFRFVGTDGAIEIGGFAMLRNVSIRLINVSEEFSQSFEVALNRRLSQESVETSPAAVSLLLVATAMLVVPTTLMVHRVPEIVRIISDLLH